MITEEYIIKICNHPHLLGHLAGYEDLTELHSMWIRYIFNRQLISRTLQAHRGSYKTSAVTIIGSVYWLLFHPGATIGIVRKSFTEAKNCVKAIGEIIRKEEIQAIFRAIHNKPCDILVNNANMLTLSCKTSITPEGSVNAYGLFGRMTGKHLDLLLMDDIVTLEDKISEAERVKTAAKTEEIANNVLNRGGLISYIGTPWHQRDAFSLKFVPPPLKFDVFKTGLMTRKQIQEKQEKTTNVTFAANYLLKHVSSEDAIFKDPQYELWDFSIKTAIGHIDKAFFGKDTNAFCFCQWNPKIEKYNLIGWIFEGDIRDNYDFIQEKYQKYFVGTMHSEHNDDKGTVSDQLRKRGILMNTYHERMNKHIKIKSCGLENGFFSNVVFAKATDVNFMIQLLDYREGVEPDDAADTFASMGRLMIGANTAYSQRWGAARKNA